MVRGVTTEQQLAAGRTCRQPACDKPAGMPDQTAHEATKGHLAACGRNRADPRGGFGLIELSGLKQQLPVAHVYPTVLLVANLLEVGNLPEAKALVETYA
jgi:hypothetical protein